MVNKSLNDPYLNISQVSAYLGNTPASTIRQWVTQRRLTSYRAGKARLFLKSDLDAFMGQFVRKSNEQLAREIQSKRYILSS